MKVYITYDRYENDEWFDVYQITTDFEEVKRDYKENLKTFISSGPDDCHSYQVQEVDMTEDEYKNLVNVVDLGDSSDTDLLKIMGPIYKVSHIGSNSLLFTDGYSDNDKLISYYCKSVGKDPEDADDYSDCEMELFDDDTLYDKVLSQYIDETYSI